MNTNKKLLFFLIGLLLTFLVPNFTQAASSSLSIAMGE